MYSKAKGSSFSFQVGFIFLSSITTKQSAKLYSRVELTHIEKCILPYKSFCLGSKNKQTKRKRKAWGDFHARSRFARSTIPEEKWGTTRSLLDRGG